MLRTEFEFDTEAEADAFAVAIRYVNDSALIIERVFGREDKIVVVIADSDYEDDEEEEGDDVCDRCMRSGVRVYRTDEDGNTICEDCDAEGDD